MTIPERLFQIAVAIDQLINTFLWVGDSWADETLSSRAYRKRDQPFFGSLMAIIDLVFFWEPDHCYHSYQAEIHRLQSPHEHRTLKIYQDCKSRDPVC
jgi:hypothetical protein